MTVWLWYFFEWASSKWNVDGLNNNQQVKKNKSGFLMVWPLAI